MNWTTVQNALHAWVVSATGLPASKVVWANQNAPRPAYPFAVLNITGESARGVDEIRYTLNAETGLLEPTICGLREFTMTCQVHVLPMPDNAPMDTPRNYLSKLRASALKPSTLTTLGAASVSIVRAMDLQSMDQAVEGRWVSIGLLDYRLLTAENVTDTSVEYIEKVSGTGTFPPSDVPVTGPWGVGV